MLVSVTPGMFMIEAQSMVELMLDDAVVNTTLPVEGEHLSPTSPAEAGEAPEKDGKE